MVLDVLLLPKRVIELTSASDAPLASVNYGMLDLVQHFFNLTLPKRHPEHQQFYRQNFDLLYTRIAAAQESAREVLSEEFEIQVQHPALIPLLRPYQEQGVRWMLGRERQPLQHSGENNLLATLTDRHGKVVHFNTVGGL